MPTPAPINNHLSGPAAPPSAPPSAQPSSWWRDAAIYQIYVPSFADGSGDGIGDLTGIQYRLGYLRELGVDAIWLSPWYPSPMANGGYDIVDHRDIDAMFGDLADADDLIADAHRHGLRVVIDLVPNHCSVEHPWFRSALVSGPGSAQRQRFWFRPGRGSTGETPPNNWRSAFDEPAWTRITEPDGTPGEWYLHLFGAAQPDLNWNHPGVRAEFEDILRFWLDRGVDGFHVDAADYLDKTHLFTDRQDVHGIFRSWRCIVDSYPGERILIGDIRSPDSQRCGQYQRSDELHAAANIDFLCCPWRAERLREVIEYTIDGSTCVDAPPTWVLSNHAVSRQVTRYGREGPMPVDLAIGTRRARVAALLVLALPGVVHIYQGDELGLWEVEDLPGATPTDGARVPMPWQPDASSFGFSAQDALSPPWLPQPSEWRDLCAQRQLDDPNSMVALYRAALRLRRAELVNGGHELTWLPTPAGALAFARSGGFRCIVNCSASPLPLAPRHEVLLATGPVAGAVPADTAVWLRTADTGAAAAEWPLAG